MPEAYYPGITAGDAASVQPDGSVITALVQPNATVQVFELTDMTFSAPLTVRNESGLTFTQVKVGALPVLPDLYVQSSNFAHKWKSGELVFRRDSNDAKDQAVADALAAAQLAATNAGTAAVAVVEQKLADGEFKGDDGKDGSNVATTRAAVAGELQDPASPSRALLDATVAGAIVSGVQPGGVIRDELELSFATKADLASAGSIYFVVDRIAGNASPEINARLLQAREAGGGTVALAPGHVYDIHETLKLDGTKVTLDLNGATLRTVTASSLTLVNLEDPRALPQYTRPIIHIGGKLGARITQAALRNGLVDDSVNQATTGSFANVVVAHADSTVLDNVLSVNSATNITTPLGNVAEGLCLLVENASDTTVNGGEYKGSGYDSVRVAYGAEGTRFVAASTGWAKRGSVQLTPGSRGTTFISSTLDNIDGPNDTSHALYGHNTHDVEFIGGILRAKLGNCFAFFGDGDLNRVGTTDTVRANSVILDHRGTTPAVRIWSNFVKNIQIDAQVASSSNSSLLVVQDSLDGLDVKLKGTGAGAASAFNLKNVTNFKIETDTVTTSTANSHFNMTGCSKGRITGRIEQPGSHAALLDGCSDVKFTGFTPKAADGIWAVGAQARIDVIDNDFSGITHANPLRVFGPASGVVRGNRKVVTEKAAAATILAASTSVTIAHGLWAGTATTATPRTDRLWRASDFQVSFAGFPGAAKAVWIGAVTPTQATFVVDAAPGVDVALSWSARMDRES